MEQIQHKAVVVAVEGNIVEVEMTVNDACEGCRAKEVCGAGGEQRIVAIHDTYARSYTPGEEVMISLDEIMGVKAVVYAYIVPFFIMIAVMFGTKAFDASDWVSGGGALGAAALYYVGLWLMRGKLEKEIVFKINKL
ncbi:MAG: SoxR reducing system RseC family protein [Rikenellaceae bacterium]|nr:SoxR reducing system RseC family protein [Rikenellaceae bacterium]